mmetsp:Transcript_23000/g.59074  ORF Transcript_23000/g.59074 Transcript_23000/m.59074 type:complete len:240 (-) Transcript_23000:2750-3469(-)
MLAVMVAPTVACVTTHWRRASATTSSLARALSSLVLAQGASTQMTTSNSSPSTLHLSCATRTKCSCSSPAPNSFLLSRFSRYSPLLLSTFPTRFPFPGTTNWTTGSSCTSFASFRSFCTRLATSRASARWRMSSSSLKSMWSMAVSSDRDSTSPPRPLHSRVTFRSPVTRVYPASVIVPSCSNFTKSASVSFFTSSITFFMSFPTFFAAVAKSSFPVTVTPDDTSADVSTLSTLSSDSM